jgi:hypothetical protein
LSTSFEQNDCGSSPVAKAVRQLPAMSIVYLLPSASTISRMC